MPQLLRLMRHGFKQNAVLRMSPDEIAALQLQRLQALVAYARLHSPFYAERLRDVDPCSLELADLPVLTKAEMMQHFDDVVTDRRLHLRDLEDFMSDPARLGQWYLGRYALTRTSGSTGTPAVIVQDRGVMELLFALEMCSSPMFPTGPFGFVQRLLRRSRLAVISIGRGFYPSAAGLAYAPEATWLFVNRLWITKIDPFDEVVEQLNRFQPDALLAYASVLEKLAREELAGRLHLQRAGRLRQIVNMSEPLSTGARKLVSSTFGLPITNNYASGECMILSLGCPQEHGMHVQADWVILEVVDRHNRPAASGCAGEKILVTNLYNNVQPMIRYEIGDVVTLSPTRCPCGNPLPLITSVEGRTDDVVWIRDGDHFREVHPYVLMDRLDEFPAVGWYQISQVARNRFQLRAVRAANHPLTVEELRQVVMDGLRQFGLADLIELDVALVDDVAPNPKSGKLKRIISQIGPPPEVTAQDSAVDVSWGNRTKSKGVLQC